MSTTIGSTFSLSFLFNIKSPSVGASSPTAIVRVSLSYPSALTVILYSLFCFESKRCVPAVVASIISVVPSVIFVISIFGSGITSPSSSFTVRLTSTIVGSNCLSSYMSSLPLPPSRLEDT